MLGSLIQREALHAISRIVNYDLFLLNGFQNNEMLHVPMYNRRQSQLIQIGNLESQRPAGEVKMSRHLDQTAECGSLQRYRVLTPKAVQVDLMPMIGNDHSETGK